MIVRELLTRLGWSVDTAGPQKYDNALQKVNQKAVALTTTLQGMMAAAAAAFSVKAIANTIDQVTSLEARIAQLPQTIGKSGDAFNYLTDKANQARQPIEAYMALYTRIGYATKELLPTQQELSGVVDTISKSFVLGGAAATEQAAAMLQLSQAFNKGKLDGDEFRSVMENMPGQVTQALAEAMGYLNKGELMKASSDGKLMVDELVKGLRKIGPEIEKSFMRMPMTIGQATAIASNKWARFIAKMNRESGAVTWMLGLFNKLVDGLENFGDAAAKFFGSSTNLVKFLGLAITAILLPAIARMTAAMAAFFLTPQGMMLVGLLAIALALEDIYQWTQDNESLTGKWLGSLATFKESVIKWLADVKQAFSDAINHFTTHWSNWWISAKQTMQDIVDQMTALVPDWIKDLFSKGADVSVNIAGGVADVQSKFINPNEQQNAITSPQAAAALMLADRNAGLDLTKRVHIDPIIGDTVVSPRVNDAIVNPRVNNPEVKANVVPVIKRTTINPEIVRQKIDQELVRGIAKWGSNANNQSGAAPINNVAHNATSNISNSSYGGSSVRIGDISVTVTDTNASAQDIGRETAAAVAARARVGGLSSMGLK